PCTSSDLSSVLRRRPRSPLFPYATLFRSGSAWNDWFWPSFVLNGEKYPLATAIKRFVIDARRLDLNVRFAILTMVMVPPIAIFLDRKSTRLNSSHVKISYAVFCLKKKTET